MAKQYPISSDYDNAFYAPEICFKVDELKKVESIKSPNGDFECCAGGTAVVFKVKINEKFYALRFFLIEKINHFERCKKISDFVRENPRYFVDFTYYDASVLVKGELYPVIKMEWVDGDILYSFLKKNLFREDILKGISIKLVNLFLWLKQEKIAHGDLSHQNIMVNSQSEVKLIDYDGMFIQGLEDEESGEGGTFGFIHPKGRDYSSDMDNFSMWIIYLSIEILIIDASYFNKDNDIIVFDGSDFTDLDNSDTVKKLKNSGNDKLVKIIKFIESICRNESSKVPEFNKNICIDKLATKLESDKNDYTDFLNLLEIYDDEVEYELPMVENNKSNFTNELLEILESTGNNDDDKVYYSPNQYLAKTPRP